VFSQFPHCSIQYRFSNSAFPAALCDCHRLLAKSEFAVR